MESLSFALSRQEIMGHLEAATAQHWQAAQSLGVRMNGRPTKYRPEFALFAYSLLTDFRTIATISYVAAMLGVSRSTLYLWLQTHDDFKFGVECGKALQECWLATCLLHGHPNARGILFVLKNLHGWQEVGRQLPRADLAKEMREREKVGEEQRLRAVVV